MPSGARQQFQTFALYVSAVESTPTSVTVHRNYTLGEVIFMPKEYADLRSFYNKFETKDQESVVLTVAPTTAAKSTTATN